ncbi:winged helix family transcriptional regulator [Dorea longicatena]|jgi:two-component system response regulator CssR|nr:winged helix-turn-helix domain-containing protein [Clostridium sp.]RGC59811.1 winged helix family transcriptional regulator [Dorea longicatena]
MGQIVERERLLKVVWDINYYGSGRVLDDTVRRLRKKMPDLKLETVYGLGYRLNAL